MSNYLENLYAEIDPSYPFFITKLRQIAQHKGFGRTSFYRKKFWPILLQITDHSQNLESELLNTSRNISKFTDQIAKDVDRSLYSYISFQSATELEMYKNIVSQIINKFYFIQIY